MEVRQGTKQQTRLRAWAWGVAATGLLAALLLLVPYQDTPPNDPPAQTLESAQADTLAADSVAGAQPVQP
ncbi:MAG: hypothetical protein OHK0039_48720 [Bacteroidia bacterium]